MNRPNKKGIALVWILAALLVLAVLGTQLGKMLFFSIRSRNRMEAKASIIDNEDTLVGLIAGRLKTIVNSDDPCAINQVSLQDKFNATPELVFPAPLLRAKIETDPDQNDSTLKKIKTLLPNPRPGTERELNTAADSCGQIKTPFTNTKNAGFYTFCVALDTSNVASQRSQSFVFSEFVLVKVRADLVHQALTQDEKVIGVKDGSDLLPAPVCSSWKSAPDGTKQFKVMVQIFWKSRNESEGYYSHSASKVLNLSQLRSL